MPQCRRHACAVRHVRPPAAASACGRQPAKRRVAKQVVAGGAGEGRQGGKWQAVLPAQRPDTPAARRRVPQRRSAAARGGTAVKAQQTGREKRRQQRRAVYKVVALEGKEKARRIASNTVGRGTRQQKARIVQQHHAGSRRLYTEEPGTPTAKPAREEGRMHVPGPKK